ncbi:MAG: hypothetical protein DMF78_23960 [Acidobacteria bacterium]|nr:MAG: hypothetical protein DMF78_23960 [Acidobacteriota bacterium]
MYEHHHSPLAPRAVFLRRLAGHFGVAAALMLVSLGAGILGYRWFEHLRWADAFLNAAMLLGGEGPVEAPATRAGKLFAGLYALYSGMVFVVAAGILMAPVIHRIMHRFHWTPKDGDGAGGTGAPA